MREFTLVFFFAMGAVCGWVSHAGGAKAQNMKLNLLAAILGAVSYYVLNIGRNIVELMLAGSAFVPAVLANSAKIGTSAVNAVIAVLGAMLLIVPLQKALRAAHVLDKFE